MRRALIAGLVILFPTVASAETLNLYAAGSLRAALTEVARAFEAKNGGLKVEAEFAASGLLRERIEKGEAAHVFASADMGHPQKLADGGLARTQVGGVCPQSAVRAGARRAWSVTPATLLDALLDPSVRLGTSTPKADPSGDYAFALFAKAEARKPGATRGAGGQGAAAHRRAHIREGAGRPEPVRLGDGERQGRHLPHLLHQCRAGAERGADPADRADPARAECRRRLWDDRAEGRAGSRRHARGLHPRRGRAGDPGRLRLRARRPADRK